MLISILRYASLYCTFSDSGQYGQQMQIQGVVRGCVPYKAMSPYGFDKCYDMSDTVNPYVQFYLTAFSKLALYQNVVLEAGVTGHVCMCSHHTNCNTAHHTLPTMNLYLFCMFMLVCFRWK